MDGSDKKYRILIVEDSSVYVKHFEKIITSAGYTAAGYAENGKQGLELYKELKPDIVTMDIEMPVMDGLTACKEILNYDPRAVIVMLTSVSMRHRVIDAIKTGAKNYILKSDSQQDILNKLASVQNFVK